MLKIRNWGILVIALSLFSGCAGYSVKQEDITKLIAQAAIIESKVISILETIETVDKSMDNGDINIIIEQSKALTAKVIELKNVEDLSVTKIDEIMETGKVIYDHAEIVIKPHFSKLPPEVQNKLLATKAELTTVYTNWKTVSSPANTSAVSSMLGVVDRIIPVVAKLIVVL